MFRKFARVSADVVGSAGAFLASLIVTILWAAAGPYYHYSDTWQLVINTGTSVATFLVVFLIQNTQNRDARVMQLKLDELIRAIQPARTHLIQMEGLTDEQLIELQKEFESHRDRAIADLEKIQSRRKSFTSAQDILKS
ncbi:MAG TPA: low affinity iron permease family protein [Bryobacteraceae bacterium]|nr:low affinity iron permease family protein [Bryobacteraceae bacterium]